jgi:hypothetical protein
VTRNVYSAELYSDELFTPGSSVSDEVPAGFVWVVRDISVYLIQPDLTGAPPNFAWWRDSFVNCFWSVDGAYTQTPRTYHWEGRKVLTEGQFLTFATSAGESDVCACGYILTLP